jgi:hypothetical protein
MLTSTPSRRAFLKGAVVAGAALAVPSSLSAPIFAAPSALSPRDRRLFAIAQAELDRLGGRITHHDLVAIADFGHHSAKPRFHFLSFKLNKVRSFLVTHGQGSDADHNGWLSAYSNRDGSLATSRGAYVTGEVYEGKYGTSTGWTGWSRPTATPALVLSSVTQRITRVRRMLRSMASLVAPLAASLWTRRISAMPSTCCLAGACCWRTAMGSMRRVSWRRTCRAACVR